MTSESKKAGLSPHSPPTKLGIIAGSKSLPLIFAREAREKGIRHLVAVGVPNETDPELTSLVDIMVWLRVGQLSKMIAAFVDNEIEHCVMLGQIAPRNLFEVRPDLRAMRLLLRLKEKNAHTLFGAIADELQSDGVRLIDPFPWLQSILATDSFALGPRLTREQQSDVEFGYRIAKQVSALEIGQTVVVKEGTVLAVEGFEGTDKCLERGGGLAGSKGGAVAVKVARHNHDMRFDVPCIGAQTTTVCIGAGISVLAVEAGKTFVLDRPEIEQQARKHRLAVVAVAAPAAAPGG
jgi:DUF1009 family protein